jgi:predicted negative regulator of RcsB-dependent stress response
MSDEILNNSMQHKIQQFIKKNLKNLIVFIALLILILFGFFFYKDLQKKEELKISENYIQASIKFEENKKAQAKEFLENIINKDHKFYSPLALYFIIDKKLETDPLKIMNYFDNVLSIRSIEKENLNLIKIKKAIFLFDLADEEKIIDLLNPVINSDSVWRNMAIKLMSDYFLSKDQTTKANEYIQLLNNKIKK